MAGSLQDQLLKAGLADKQKAKQVKRDKHKKVKAKQKHKVVEVDENKIAAEQALAEKKAKDQALNQQAKAVAEEKAVAAQVKQLIEINKQPRKQGDLVCNFTDGTLVKRLYVDQFTHNHITQGKLAIVKLNQGYELVPMPVADKIAERVPDSVVYRADKREDTEEKASQDDDWYADYEIPDDLTW